MDSIEDTEVRWPAPGPGQWRQGLHVPRPLTPIAQEIHPPAFRAGFETGFARLGAPLRTIDERVVNGVFYSRPVPLVDRPGATPPPAAILKLLMRLHPEFRRRTKQATATLEQQSWRYWVDRWHNRDVNEWTARHTTLQSVNPGQLEPQQLERHFDEAMKNTEDALVAHFELAPIESIAIGRLIVEGAERWALSTDDVVAALRGASPATTATIRALEPLRNAVDGARVETVDEIRAVSPEAAQLLDDWMRKHGWWTLTGYDLDALTIGEVPSTIITALNTPATQDRNPGAAIAVLLDKVPSADQVRATELIEAARQGHGLRDAIGPCTAQWPLGLLRRAVLEIGRRAEFANPDLATEATSRELREMIDGPSRVAESELAVRRQRRYELGRAGLPLTIGEPEPAPPVDSMPRALADLTRMSLAVLALEWPSAKVVDTDDESMLRGQGIGTATITGRARVVFEPRGDIDLDSGDILVAPCTTPTWGILLASAAGLVVEEGGLVAHSAIVARELDIPAVVGARGACGRVPDEALIELDPVRGTVRVLDSSP